MTVFVVESAPGSPDVRVGVAEAVMTVTLPIPLDPALCDAVIRLIREMSSQPRDTGSASRSSHSTPRRAGSAG